MKIAYLSTGKSVYDRRFLEKMVKRDIEAHLISYYNGKLIKKIDGVEVHHYPMSQIIHFNHLHEFQVGWHLRRLLKRIKPDVLHSGYVRWAGFYGALSGFHPTLLMPWGSDILIEPDNSFFTKLVTKFTIKRANLITCDGKNIKNKIISLTNYPADKIIRFPWGIDLNTFRPKFSNLRKKLGWENNKILIMTRRFKPIYGVEYFIKALPIIMKQDSYVRAILVGAGPSEEKLKKMINELGISKKVFLLSWINQEEMSNYLNTADIYVSTSFSDGTSSSLLEAMACSLPVVVTSLEGNIEWVKDGTNGYLVPVRDSKILAGRLLELLDNTSLRRKMGARNLKIARSRADWEKNFDKLEVIYRLLVKNG